MKLVCKLKLFVFLAFVFLLLLHLFLSEPPFYGEYFADSISHIYKSEYLFFLHLFTRKFPHKFASHFIDKAWFVTIAVIVIIFAYALRFSNAQESSFHVAKVSLIMRNSLSTHEHRWCNLDYYSRNCRSSSPRDYRMRYRFLLVDSATLVDHVAIHAHVYPERWLTRIAKPPLTRMRFPLACLTLILGVTPMFLRRSYVIALTSCGEIV